MHSGYMPVIRHVFYKGFSLFVLPFHSLNCVRPGFSCMLSSRSFVALHLISANHFEWIFVRGIRSLCALVGRHGFEVLARNSLYCFCFFVKTSWLYLCGSISRHLYLFATVQQIPVTK